MASPNPTRPRRGKIVCAVLLTCFGLMYLAGPAIASIFEIGDRRGPKIYPIGYHRFIYMAVWEMTPHEATKPRVGINPPPRPWFYGM